MELKTVTCDECRTPKGLENHWFKAIRSGGMFQIAPADSDAGRVIALAEGLLQILDLCSENCAVKAMSKAIGQVSKPPDPLTNQHPDSRWHSPLTVNDVLRCEEIRHRNGMPRRRWHEQPGAEA